jgi:transposase, IS5 family
MARRRIGQEQLNVGGVNPRREATLDEMSALIDWMEIGRHLAGIYASARGETRLATAGAVAGIAAGDLA